MTTETGTDTSPESGPALGADRGAVERVAAARRRPRDRKQQILAQARELFVERGYPNVSMALLAERVDITAPALYRHYANKAELLEAVVRDSFSELGPTLGVEGSLDEALENGAPLAIARPYVATLWSRESRHLPNAVRTEVRGAMRRSTQAYVPLIHAERPELTDAQVDLVAWGVQSVLASPSRHRVKLAVGEHAALLAGAARALVWADLVDAAPSGESAAPVVRQPVSRRERLLAAAIRMFAERGYPDTSMADIAAAAEVTGPNLYGYYENKADLLEAVIERGTHALWLDLDTHLAVHKDAGDALLAVVAGYVRLTRHWGGLRVATTGEQDAEDRYLGIQREYLAEWVSLLREARPGLSQPTARIHVHVALEVIEDLSRTPHLAARSDFDANLTALATAVLGLR